MNGFGEEADGGEGGRRGGEEWEDGGEDVEVEDRVGARWLG